MGATDVSRLKELTQQFKALCERVGGKPRPFALQWVDFPANEVNVADLFHQSGLLVKGDAPVIVYIRDNSISYNHYGRHQSIHFITCEVIKRMKKAGRIKRYHVTGRDDNSYIVEYGEGKTDNVRLFPCECCLRESNYQGYGDKAEQRIKEEFDAKEAHAFMAEKLFLFYLGQNLSDESDSTFYVHNHARISLEYRREKKFTCDECGVKLAHYWWLTDMHHKNGVKRDNDPQNLQCLCKLCHRAVHPHYRVKASAFAIIRKVRKEQGIG